MQQLSGVDAFHVLGETPDQHMHTIKIALLAPTDECPVTADGVRTWVAERLSAIPPLRWRLVPAPLKLGRPVWVDGGPLDTGYHLRTHRLARGDAEQLDEVVSEILSIPLDRAHPLWQVTVVEGLADGRVALVFKLHHSIMDGQAAVRFLETAFDPDPPDTVSPPPHPGSGPASPLPPPSRWRVAMFVLRADVALWARLPSVLGRTLTAVRANRARRKAGVPPVANPLSGPSTLFNHGLRPHRVYVDVTLPLARIRALREATGATVNDLFVTLCGGAIRRYVSRHGEEHVRCMNAAVPVSLRRPEEADRYGNRTSYWYVSLGTDVADPVQRLAQVRASIEAAREWAKGDVELFAVWQDYYTLFGIVTLRTLALAERLSKRPAFNAIVSNVRGPRPLALAGAPVVAVRSAGPLTGRLGLNMTAWSYRDEFSIGLHACRAAAPDLRLLADDVRAELAAFEAAVPAVPVGTSGA